MDRLRAGGEGRADGYNLLLAYTRTYQPVAVDQVPTDTLRDFAPVTWWPRCPVCYCPSVRTVRSVAELIAFANAVRTNSTTAAPASHGRASGRSVVCTTWPACHLTHVPLQRRCPGDVRLLGGQISIMSAAWRQRYPISANGRIRALAVPVPARGALPKCRRWPRLVARLRAIGWFALFCPHADFRHGDP